MIRLVLAFLGGVATATAALALYGRIPHPVPDIDPADTPPVAPMYPPSVPLHLHDSLCHWPQRPCICSMMPRTTER